MIGVIRGQMNQMFMFIETALTVGRMHRCGKHEQMKYYNVEEQSGSHLFCSYSSVRRSSEALPQDLPSTVLATTNTVRSTGDISLSFR